MSQENPLSLSELKQEIARANANLRRMMSQIDKIVRSSEQQIAHSKELLEQADALLNREPCEPVRTPPPDISISAGTTRAGYS
jgi:hypothetical protein